MEHGDDVHAVAQRARHHRARHRRAQEVDEHRALALEALIGLDATLRLVAGVDHHDLDRMALDPAPGIHERNVVALSLRVFRGDEGIDRGEVERRADLDRRLVLRRRRHDRSQRRGDRQSEHLSHEHFSPFKFNVAFTPLPALPLKGGGGT